MNILSLHSQVVAGHVGNSAAVLPLQILGFEVWAVPTVVYSNHPGLGSFTGRVTPAQEITAIVDGLDQRGLLTTCDGVLIGYMGDPTQAPAAAEIVKRARSHNPDVIVCCDPILGDRDGGQYVREGVPDEISKHLIPKANLTTPNHFELETLTGTSIRTLDEALAAAGRLREAGPEVVVCTSLERTETPPGQVETLLVGPEGAWLGRHNAVTQAPHGTGDMLAALLLGHWLRGEPPERALAAALSAVWSVVQASTDTPDQELALVSAQAQITAPSHTVQVEKVWPGGLKPPF